MDWILDIILWFIASVVGLGWIVLVMFQAIRLSHVYFGGHYEDFSDVKTELYKLITAIIIGWLWPIAAIAMYVEEKLTR